MTDNTSSEIEELEAYLAELKKQEDDFAHQLRRHADHDIRASAGPQRQGEERRSLERNLAECQKERARVEDKLEQLRATRGNA